MKVIINLSENLFILPTTTFGTIQPFVSQLVMQCYKSLMDIHLTKNLSIDFIKSLTSVKLIYNIFF